MAFTERVRSGSNSLYNEDRNLLRIREKERRNQEAHQEKEAFSEKIPLFGEPYKTEKGDELSSRIQNMLGNYEEVKELLSTKSLAHHLDASESRPGKPRYPLFPEKGSGVPPHSFHTRVHHQPGSTPASGPLPVGNMSHNQKVTQPRMEPMPSLHVKSYGAPDSQHLAQDRLGQEGYSSSHRKNGDRRAEGDHCASTADSAPERELSPLLSSLPSPLPPLSPLHSNQQTLPRSHGSSKVHSSNNNNNNKGYCHAKSPKDLAVKIRDKETPKDSLVAVSSLGVAPPQPPPQSFPPPSLPSKSVAMQQKPTAYVRPMDGQDQAPSESPELKPLPEDYRQQTFEKTDLKVPAKAKLTKLKMPSQSVEQTYSNEVHCVEEILKEMTHSWPPPLTAIHTPSTAEPSKFPFPTKDSQHISSATQNQKQYDTSSKTRPHSQQGTSMLEDDLQLSDSEDSESEQAPEKPPATSAPPSAPQSLPEAAASAHSSGAESESTSDSDSSSDSESESSSSDSEENEPQDTPAPEPPGKGSRQKKPEDKQPPAGKKLDSEKRSSDNSSKLAKKRKGEAERDHDSKKVRLEKEVKSQSSSSSHKEASKTKTPRPSEPSKKEMLPPTLVSSSSSSSQKPAKPTQKRPRREAHPCSQDPPKSASSTKGNHKDSPAPKRRKAEGKGSGSSTEQKGSSGDTANSFPVPSLPNGNSKPGKPPSKLDKQADLHMKEAKKLKQKAELMTDKVGKAFKYLEAVLSFIECGIAMESESPVSKSASKSAFAVYSETEDLVKVIMSLKSFSDPTAPTQEKIFAVLCMRCQSILNMAMFRCKKERAIKYSRALNDHFQSPSKVTQAPSPCIARSTGAPSPLSPMPSASSVGSQASAGSVGGSGIPANIQNMTSSYITITSHIFAAVDLWEQAEVLTRKNKEFFAQLSTSVCTLALNSSLADLVHYTRQGFQWLKQGSRAP
ncbi:AF4/FMR2 family member 1 isoform X8 [Myotis lucifugus]|uniref:AF4/FMR2 family member 1 isoform X8 n=1 Tax=Myotis lucifugus TaxID=59463 RepID=UPI000CCC7298|nr:AF4/FMR2 family member 1 isoform X8 [Myotis lucifugus]